MLLSQGLSDYTFSTAQSSSLAGAVVSNRGGSWSLYNNPATLVELEENRLSLGYSKLYSQDYLPLSSIGIIISQFKINFGFKYSSLSVKNNDIELLNEDLLGVVAGINLVKDKKKKRGCIYADTQTKGRGKHGKVWVSVGNAYFTHRKHTLPIGITLFYVKIMLFLWKSILL